VGVLDPPRPAAFARDCTFPRRAGASRNRPRIASSGLRDRHERDDGAQRATGDRAMRRLLLAFALVPLAVTAACAVSSEEPEPEGETTSAALSASDPVSAAVGASCSTTAVKGLATQLVEEIQCLKPGSMSRLDTIKGLSLGAAVFPYLQTPAAKALEDTQKARGVTMTINSAMRTLPQQYLLYRWYKTGRCGISLAATPGTSNHESALAVDVEDTTGWRSAFQNHSFRWLGASDPVHYDFVGGGRIDLKGLSVLAFQRLWNRNHPGDKIAEDGDYGPATETRLAQSPSGGFAIGAAASCTTADAGADAGGPATDDVPVVPDGDEPAKDEPAPSTLGASGARGDSGGGCSTSRSHPTDALAIPGILLALVAASRLRRRTVGST
jgi:hypothetical protein